MKSNGIFSLSVFAISIILFSGFFYYQPASAEPFVNGLKIATSGSHVYTVWQKHSDAPLVKRDVYFRTSSDNGVTFGDTVRLNDDTTQSNPWGDGGILERVPFVSASENHVYILWDEFGTDVPTPKWYFAVSDDYGAHFRRPILLDGGDSTASTNMMASGNNVYIFWINGTLSSITNFKVMVQTSKDNGRTFEESIALSNYDKNREILFPQLAASGDGVVAAWYAPSLREGGKNDVYVSRMGDQNMSSVTILNNSTANYKLDKLAASGNNVYVLVQNIVDVKNPNGSTVHKTDEYLVQSTDGGRTFGKSMDLSGSYDGFRDIDSADLTISGNNIYVMWNEDDDQSSAKEMYRVYAIASSDGGNSFGSKTLISEYATANNIVANGNNVYLPYQVSSARVHSQVFLATSTDGGKSFESKALSNSTTSAEQEYGIMLDNGKVNVAWLNSVGDSDTIFYLGDIGAKPINLLGIPKYYQSIWINDYTSTTPNNIVKKPILNVTPVNKTKQETPVANTTMPIHGTTHVMTTKVDSPLKQFKSGVMANNVICKQGLKLIFKEYDGSPACVKPTSVTRLLQQGWALQPYSDWSK